MRLCKVKGCRRRHSRKGYCKIHHRRVERYGRTELLTDRRNKDGSLRRPDGLGHIGDSGYMFHRIKGKLTREHIMIVEKVLGKKLPKGAVIHHVDGNRQNNDPRNLVVCPNSAYHNLIHRRMRALEACGNPTWFRCRFCDKWDAPENMYVKPSGWEAHHRECRQIARRSINNETPQNE